MIEEWRNSDSWWIAVIMAIGVVVLENKLNFLMDPMFLWIKKEEKA